jgi:lipid-A-disaccharide synthase-like uncharacterized protein
VNGSEGLLPVLAIQVLDGVGWAGQAVFTWRMLHQWWSSEKARRSVLPADFWRWSLIGTALLLVYQLHRMDGVFLAGVLLNGVIYARNLRLATHPRPPGTRSSAPWIAFVVSALGVLALSLALWWGEAPMDWDQPLPWLLVGVLGQAAWSSRFVIQWWVSERCGQSVLPVSFFVLSILGSVLLCAYAVHRLDYVMIAAYAFNPVPYARNLALLLRERRAGRVGA